MRKEITVDKLLQGAWYALEQAGQLALSAVTLFEYDNWSTAVGVAILVCEEVGRSRILQTLAREAAGKTVAVQKVTKACEDHFAKLAASGGTTMLSSPPGSELNKQMKIFMDDPQSDAGNKALAVLDKMVERKRKRVPGERHQLRMRSFYVDLSPAGEWLRPADISCVEAYRPVNQAVNIYSVARLPLQGGFLETASPEMARVKRSMNPTPVLAEPRWPESPAVKGS